MFSSRGVLFVAICTLITGVRSQGPDCQDETYDIAVGVTVASGHLPRPLSSGDTINVYWWCIGDLENAYRQVWLLQGGPGGYSYGLHGDLVYLYGRDSSGYYCTTDYRGVGCSDQLLCSNQTQNGCDSFYSSSGCIAEIQQRYNFSDFYTEQAAYDVIALIEMNQETNPGAEVIIYGVSYGTFWVQRIMQLSNNIADKWIFDGVVLQPWFQNSGWQYFFSIGAFQMLDRFLNDCFQDPVCQQYFTQENYFNWRMKMLGDSSLKLEFSNDVYNIFSGKTSLPNNFVAFINGINELLSNGVINQRKRDVICSSDQIVYLIVKANELYTDYISNDEFLFLNDQLPFDIMTADISSAIPWIQDDVKNLSPIVTNGSILVLGGEYDIQTVADNSLDLHNYFLSQGVNSTLLEGMNWGHGVFWFTSLSDPECGHHILSRFILGEPLQPECLSSSTYTNFTTATYFVPPTTTPTPSSTSSNGTIIYFLTPSSSGALIAVSVLLALTWAGILGFVGYVVYRRYFQPYPKVQIDAVNLVERIEAL
jgi:pimeloyl-ACP methyl ester carboxylesterase